MSPGIMIRRCIKTPSRASSVTLSITTATSRNIPSTATRSLPMGKGKRSRRRNATSREKQEEGTGCGMYSPSSNTWKASWLRFKDSGGRKMWERIRYWLHRDSRKMHCRAFCGRCPYFEQCRCDAEEKCRP